MTTISISPKKSQWTKCLEPQSTKNSNIIPVICRYAFWNDLLLKCSQVCIGVLIEEEYGIKQQIKIQNHVKLGVCEWLHTSHRHMRIHQTQTHTAHTKHTQSTHTHINYTYMNDVVVMLSFFSCYNEIYIWIWTYKMNKENEKKSVVRQKCCFLFTNLILQLHLHFYDERIQLELIRLHPHSTPNMKRRGKSVCFFVFVLWK